MTLIWTRAVSDWSDDRIHLPAGTVHIPCLRRVSLVPHVAEGYPFPYVVVSSVAAVQALAGLVKLRERLVSSTFFCFGRRTASELAVNGYRQSLCPVTSSAGLVDYLADQLPATSRLAVLTAKQPAFPVAEGLRARGFEVSQFVLYQTIVGASLADGSVLDANQRATIANNRSVICFASPSAVQGFTKVFHNEIDRLKKKFRAVAIGQTTARQLTTSLPSIPCYLADDFTLTSLIKTALRISNKTTDNQLTNDG